MNLVCVSRSRYRDLTREGSADMAVPELLAEIGAKGSYIVPEGGGNVMGMCGCSEILDVVGHYDIIAVCCGTGTTLAGKISCKRV